MSSNHFADMSRRVSLALALVFWLGAGFGAVAMAAVLLLAGTS